MVKPSLWIGLVCIAAGAASAANRPSGAYICTVEQKAGIGGEMMEGSDPPAAFIDKASAKFRIVVTPPTKKAKGRVRETAHTVLKGDYVGDGWRFGAVGEQGLLHIDFIGEAGWLWFYHAGFEKPDIDHLNLSVRSGPCEPAT